MKLKDNGKSQRGFLNIKRNTALDKTVKKSLEVEWQQLEADVAHRCQWLDRTEKQ